MRIYFWLIRLAALFGNRKARLLIEGERRTLREERDALSELRGAIWFHAASVGEFEQARPIIEKLVESRKTASPKDYRQKVVLTFFSPSGYEMRKNYDKVDKVLYLPFATKKRVKTFLDALQPSMAIFVKYEFWPAYLKEIARRNIPLYSISAIFRQDQLFFRPWGKSYLKLLKCFTHIFVQDEASKELLNTHGINAVSVAGDTRFDRVCEIAKQAKSIPAVERFVGSVPNTPVIIAGSTWPPDEELFARYLEKRPNVKLVLVPHEIDEAHLHKIFQVFEGRYVRYSEATPATIEQVRVLVVDAMGILSSIYRYGQVAYIGGGFGVGIHNTLEAAVYGMPVLFGPNYSHFREAKGLIAAGGSKSVKDYESFEKAMDKALAQYKEMGKKALEYVESERGATAKICKEIFGN
ncbi:MAG: 3-deoxy-D-manno-octulosonic acid transferase [Paludibacteraceae bacterium]|nr:3-deoxy-D-manno-octulosonic acid transferase [Paludibacteraceae bacterium]